MGQYVNSDSKGNSIGVSFFEKLRALENDGATIVDGDTFQDNLVCLVDNGAFAAAGYAYDKQEFEAFNYPTDRRQIWLLYPKVKEVAK